jgi:predicted phosphodiesterase
MRIAVLTDLHANREATEAVLAAVRALAPDRIMVLGDVVGYGPDPVFTTETVARLVEDGAVCLMGNHDEAAVAGGGDMVSAAEEAIRWTRTRLAPHHLAFLAALPMTAEAEGVLFVHASAARPKSWDYVIDVGAAQRCLAATAAGTVVCGHTHVPAIFDALPDRRPFLRSTTSRRPCPRFAGTWRWWGRWASRAMATPPRASVSWTPGRGRSRWSACPTTTARPRARSGRPGCPGGSRTGWPEGGEGTGANAPTRTNRAPRTPTSSGRA